MSRICIYTFITILLFNSITNVYAQKNITPPAPLNAQTPVLHDGRIKPLDSFARFVLKTIHGKDHFETQTATQWLIETQHNPNKALQKPIFKIRNEIVKKRLNISQNKTYVSAKELAQGFAPITKNIEDLIAQKKTKPLSKTEQDLIALYDKTLTFAALLSPSGIPIASDKVKANKIKLKWEQIYNNIKPFQRASYLYGLTALIAFATLRISVKRTTKTQKKNTIMCFGLFVCATLIHMIGIGTRVYILSRPPVGTLHESVLFVSFVCALLGLVITFIKSNQSDTQNNITIIGASALTSAALLMIAPFTLNGQDELGTLGAVLNTNFWLGTHVICITAGYATCIICALMAHISLIKPNLAITKTIYIMSIVALLLTATGTALGGIWADQSWGRFWGWDPKENGALLIVLWLTWLHHGKLGNKLGQTSFNAGIAGLNIVVALAWFGVNLLGIGLHSYGFTTGLLSGLFTFLSIQMIVIIALVLRAKKLEKVKS